MDNLLFKLADFFLEENDEVMVPKNPERLLGDLCLNRLGGIAYLNMKKSKGLKVSKEFRWTLEAVYNDNKRKQEYLLRDVGILSEIFKESTFDYAFLKGAYLSTMLYPKGCRVSNDIDILVCEEDLSKCTKLLEGAGFVQGQYSRDKGIIPASRREILMARMNYGETVPFFKVVDDEVIMVDVNFSLDYKPEDGCVVKQMLRKARTVVSPVGEFKTLDKADFLIQLCCHLYKEATTIDWVRTRRDLLLYKFCDIYVLLMKDYLPEDFGVLLDRIKEYGVEKECYYTLVNTAEFFEKLAEKQECVDLVKEISPENLDFMKQIVCPKERKILVYDLDFKQWFMQDNRADMLKEL